jgi:hypothetical protein
MHCLQADCQNSSGLALVVTHGLVHSEDVTALNVLERLELANDDWLANGLGRCLGFWKLEVFGFDVAACRKVRRGFEHALELPYVTRPTVGLKGSPRFVSGSGRTSLRVWLALPIGQKVLGKKSHVVATISERWDAQVCEL